MNSLRILRRYISKQFHWFAVERNEWVTGWKYWDASSIHLIYARATIRCPLGLWLACTALVITLVKMFFAKIDAMIMRFKLCWLYYLHWKGDSGKLGEYSSVPNKKPRLWCTHHPPHLCVSSLSCRKAAKLSPETTIHFVPFLRQTAEPPLPSMVT